MPKTPDQLFAILDSLGIKHSTVKHPPLFTVEQSRALRGQIPGGHTKNLFLRDKKYDIYLVVALEDADIDLKGLHRRLGASGRFSFGSADLLREVLGVEPGAVTPFGAINDTESRVTIILDAAMPDGVRIERIHELYKEFVDGRGSDAKADELRKIAQEFVSREGAQSVLIAGTDLSDVFTDSNAGFPMIDCANVHIDAIVRRLLD